MGLLLILLVAIFYLKVEAAVEQKRAEEAKGGAR